MKKILKKIINYLKLLNEKLNEVPETVKKDNSVMSYAGEPGGDNINYSIEPGD
jgi:hypothetical protein